VAQGTTNAYDYTLASVAAGTNTFVAVLKIVPYVITYDYGTGTAPAVSNQMIYTINPTAEQTVAMARPARGSLDLRV